MEYGNATIEIQKNAFDFCQKDQNDISRILVVDDLLATGGTLSAACEVVNNLNKCQVTHALVIMELSALNGKSKIPQNVALTSFIKYDDWIYDNSNFLS